MNQLLLQRLTMPDTRERLAALADGAAPSALLSLRLKLGPWAVDWLDFLPRHEPYWYRARPNHREFRLGIGHALHVATAGANRFASLDNAFAGLCRQWRRDGQALAFAGFAFDDAHQNPLPNALLSIPAVLLESLDGEGWLTLSTPADRLAEAFGEWQQRFSQGQARSHLDATEWRPPRSELLADQAWIARVKAALRDIEAGHLAKVVLSRHRRVEAMAPLQPSAILARLIEQQAAGVIYAYGNGRQTFLGASPERLVRLCNHRVSVDALAGTAWPGSQAPLTARKNRLEQSLVVQSICQALAPLCTGTPAVGPLEERTAGHLVHLRNRIEAEVRPETRLFELVRTLHPTPAVGGFPPAAALTWLAAHDEQRSAWYSGGFGLLTPEGDGEFSVALRSALIDGHKADLQAGAGIVSGSDPLYELAEIEAKLGTLLAALQPGNERNSRIA